MVTEVNKNRPPKAQEVEKFTATPEWLRKNGVNPYRTQAGVRHGTRSWYSVGQSEKEIGKALEHTPPETISKQSKAKTPKIAISMQLSVLSFEL